MLLSAVLICLLCVPQCNFAIVQFGAEIRTELSLKDNEDGAKALEKVMGIEQLKRVTKTASALYHVLLVYSMRYVISVICSLHILTTYFTLIPHSTDVFVPENGSNEKSKKMIIVLSDGVSTEKNLTEVLNMPEMNGILRFAIGVSVRFYFTHFFIYRKK